MKPGIDSKRELFNQTGTVESQFDWMSFEKDPVSYLENMDPTKRVAFIVVCGVHYRGRGKEILEKLSLALESVK